MAMTREQIVAFTRVERMGMNSWVVRAGPGPFEDDSDAW